MKERLRIQGLRKRWILNSVGPVILILVLAAILASATVANNATPRCTPPASTAPASSCNS